MRKGLIFKKGIIIALAAAGGYVACVGDGCKRLGSDEC